MFELEWVRSAGFVVGLIFAVGYAIASIHTIIGSNRSKAMVQLFIATLGLGVAMICNT